MFLIVSYSKLRAGCIFDTIPTLFLSKHVRRFKINAVQRVQIDRDLLASIVCFDIENNTVGYSSVGQQILPARPRLRILFSKKPVDNAHYCSSTKGSFLYFIRSLFTASSTAGLPISLASTLRFP